jgi:hypothetical protein
MSAGKPESPAWEISGPPSFIPESPPAEPMEAAPRYPLSLHPTPMAGVESLPNTDAFGAGADCGNGQPGIPHDEGGHWPAFIPEPLPDEWVVPPDVHQAFSHARPCPDVFALHVSDAAQRLAWLGHLAVWCPQERWWIIVPDLRRALELSQAWPDSAPQPLLLTRTLQAPAADHPPGILTLGELHNQITAQVRGRLQERLHALQRLQDITLELIQCDTLQAELAAALDTLEQNLQAEAEDEHSALYQTIHEQLTPLQQRLQECEARRCQLQEKLRLEQSLATSEPADPNKPRPGTSWFTRLKKWLLGRSSSPSSSSSAVQAASSLSHPPSATASTGFSSWQDELQAAEKELAQLRALWKAEYQQLLERELSRRRQMIQDQLAGQRAEHERLHAQRERLIQHLSLASAEGAVLEQELAHVQRQLREVESLVAEQLQRQLQEVRLFVIPAREGPDLEQLRRLGGGVDRFIYESCEQLPDGVMRWVLRLPGRHLLIGNLLSTPSCPWDGNGAVATTGCPAEATPWLSLLVSRLDQRPWVVEGGFLIARFRCLPPEQRLHLRQEPLADHPEVLLRFRDISEQETELVEMVFPQSWGFAARAFVAQQLEHYRPAPCGPAHWHSTPSGDIRVCWPAVEQSAAATPSETIDWGNGVEEWCLFDGQAFYTAALTFRAEWGWDRASAEAWLAELLPPATQQRLAVVTSRLPRPPASAPASSSPALRSAATPTL